MQKTEQSLTKPISLLLMFIFLHALILFSFCDFTKAYSVNDELVYYTIARSLFLGEGIQFHATDFPLQNIAYCLFLMPFFNISDCIIRIKAITFANALLLSLCALPVWFIGKELGLKEKYRWASVIVIFVWPDNITAASTMSENLYWLLFLTATYLWVKNLTAQNYWITVLCSTVSFLAYFCKEVALCIPLAYVGFSIAFPVLDSIVQKKDIKKQKNSTEAFHCAAIRFQDYVKLLLFLFVYGICFLFIKKIAFSGKGNVYGVDISLLASTYNRVYCIYALIYYIIAVLVAFLVFPILLPAIRYNSLNEVSRKTYIYALILLLGTITTIVLSISVREDLGLAVPRIHLRYFSQIIGVFIPVFFSSLAELQGCSSIQKKGKNKISYLILLCCLFCVLLFKGTGSPGSVNENIALAYTWKIRQAPSEILAYIFDTLGAYLNIFINLGFFVLVFLWSKLTFSGLRKATVLCGTVLIIAVPCILNLRLGLANARVVTAVNEAAIQEMRRISDYFSTAELQDTNVVLLSKQWGLHDARIYDTYFDGYQPFEITYDDLGSVLTPINASEVLVSNLVFSEVIYQYKYSIDKIDYFILADKVQNIDAYISGLEYVPDLSGATYHVYHNPTPTKLLLAGSNSTGSEKSVLIDFTEAGYNASLFVQSGISFCEGLYSWTESDILEILAKVSSQTGAVNVNISVSQTFNGNQPVEVYQDNVLIHSCELDGPGTISFSMTPINGICQFRLHLPAAISPKALGLSQDTRNLSLMLQAIEITPH